MYILHGAFYHELLLVPSRILLKGLDAPSLCSGCPFVTEGEPRSGGRFWSVGAVNNPVLQILSLFFFFLFNCISHKSVNSF